MTDDTKKKGNGEPEPSVITIEFPTVGYADPQINMQGITHGQICAGAIWLVGLALNQVFTSLAMQAQRAAQDKAMMDSIIRSAKG